MKYSLVILEEASDELDEISLYYEQIQQGLGVKFIDHWQKSLNEISKNPLAFQKIKKQYRSVLLQKFPYLVIYEEIGKTVVVYRLIHVKKHPRKRFSALK